MSRITRRIAVVVAGAAAGFALSALGSGAIAGADTAIPVNPGLGGLFEQVVASSATIPQQLLMQTASTLGGAAPASAAAPAAPGQAPLATATLNMPPNLAGNPGQVAQPAATGLSALPGDLGSMLPFPMPNLGLTAPAASAVAAPVAAVPSAPLSIPSPVLIPGLP